MILVTFGYLRKGEAYITSVSDDKTCFLGQYHVVIVKQHKKIMANFHIGGLNSQVTHIKCTFEINITI
ncbi:unnamed protein product [Schistosoma mattheei]|uniref:Uncharacterized protein n=1 Tax=Schistosoma mattheei TaxID=31246 RepID=A0A3P8EKC9_9TREM|nr:unnamed protein product [Schistosoma mattheei]